MNKKKENKKKVLIVHPTRYDRPSLLRKSITDQYDLIFYNESTNPTHLITHPAVGPLTINIHPEATLSELRHLANVHKIDGIMSAQDYPGNIVASLIAHERNLPAPSPELVTGLQHKLFSRRLQQKHVPEVTPSFYGINLKNVSELSSQQLSFPLFTKPVKANFSIFAHRVNNQEQLLHVLSSCQLPHSFTEQFDWYIEKVGINAESSNNYVAEQLLEGIQVTLEGFVYNGDVTIVGIVDSIMYPGTISFERFVYPSSIPQPIQQRMRESAIALIKGTGFNSGFFNIEFMYNSTTNVISIIEVNPRLASQFADLYEKVDGYNTFHVLLALSLGIKPLVKRHEGRFKVSASCVLRIFNNKRVAAIPTQDQIAVIEKEFPESLVFIKIFPGLQLSDIEQDGKSYAYALIHLGGRDIKEIDEKLIFCKKILKFVFVSV